MRWGAVKYSNQSNAPITHMSMSMGINYSQCAQYTHWPTGSLSLMTKSKNYTLTWFFVVFPLVQQSVVPLLWILSGMLLFYSVEMCLHMFLHLINHPPTPTFAFPSSIVRLTLMLLSLSSSATATFIINSILDLATIPLPRSSFSISVPLTFSSLAFRDVIFVYCVY